MKKTFIVLTILASAVISTQAAYFTEPFNYSDGSIVANSAGVWANNTGTAGSCLVSNQTLLISYARTEDIAHQFSPGFTFDGVTGFQTNLYARFTWMCTNTLPTAAGAYFFGFASTAPSFYMARTWCNTTNLDGTHTADPGYFYMGVGNNRPNSSGGYPTDGQLSAEFTTNIWYTVVVRHCLTNGLDTIWVGTDPTTMTESGTPSATAHDTPSTTSNIVKYVNFRQNTGEGDLRIKNLKVGGTWNDVFFAPSISAIPNQSIPRGSSTPALDFTIDSASVPVSSLTISTASSNTNLVPNQSPNIVLTSSNGNTNHTIQVTPMSSRQGTTLITVTVHDGVDTSSTSFTVSVGTPVISPIANVVAHTNTPIPPVAFTVVDPEGDPVTVTAVSSYPALIPSANVVIAQTGPGYYTATLTPVAGVADYAKITISATDGYTTNSTSFVLTVAPKLGQVFSDNFAYTDFSQSGLPNALYLAMDSFGNLSPWVSASGTAFQIQVTNPWVYLVGTNSEDVAATLTNNLGGAYGTPYYTSNTVVFYSTFQVNESQLGEYSGDYFWHLKSSATSTTFTDRLFSRTNGAGAGNWRVGIANGSASASATFPLDLSLGTTYTVVTRYNSAVGDSVLWINPYSELSRSVIGTDNLSTSSIGAVGLREPSQPDPGNLALGALKIATAWDELGLTAPALPAQIPLNLTTVGGNVQLTWTNVYFMLQSAPTPTGPWLTLPNALSGYTVPPSASQQFFRLICQ